MTLHETLDALDLMLPARPRQHEVAHQSRAEAPAHKEQRVVARDHAQQRDRQRDRIARHPAMGQIAAREQRHVLWNRQSQSAQHQNNEQSKIGEVFDVPGDQPDQAQLPWA